MAAEKNLMTTDDGLKAFGFRSATAKKSAKKRLKWSSLTPNERKEALAPITKFWQFYANAGAHDKPGHDSFATAQAIELNIFDNGDFKYAARLAKEAAARSPMMRKLPGLVSHVKRWQPGDAAPESIRAASKSKSTPFFEYEVQGNYGYGQGWEAVTTETTRKEGLERLREYRVNEPGVPFRLINKRIKRP